MTYRGFDAELLEQLDDSHRTYLLQHVLRAIEPASMLSKHVSSAGGLATELPRLAAARRSHERRGQPQARLLGRLGDQADRSVAELTALWPGNPLAGGIPDALDALLPDVERFLTDEFLVAWEHDPGWPKLVRLGDELACLVATTGRDPETLQRDLTNVARGHGDAAAFLDALLPPHRAYQVACVVRGAEHLDELAAFEPTARQEPLKHAHRLGFGPATQRLRAFLDGVEPGGCVVIIETRAPDKPSAARMVRRRLTELLDQYVAGHRLLTLALHPETVVCRAGELDTLRFRVPVGNTTRARPLVLGAPDELLGALRMAHQARATDSPTTAIALAWSALEACGVERDPLAKALALQVLRQQVADTRHLVHQSVTAFERTARKRAARADAVLRSLTGDHPEVGARRAEALRRKADADAEVARIEAELVAALDRIAEEAPVDAFHNVVDLNAWFRMLRRGEELVPRLHPLARRQVAEWRDAVAGEWLECQRHRLLRVLDAVYATRNQSLHSGVFRAEGDTVLGVGAVMVVDLTLEVLGNWYRRSRTDRAPSAVIRRLAARYDAVGGFDELDLVRLTSPREGE
ncbi:hypothetical protein FKR81_21185 [Lentzea tibetensis]|uniref:Uncharacterized protein n=1 Tax=Lentzea tibetensis TaxID=2591470 RepID=A0A563ERA1_9PSEU|nr:hypothetical protein [Lentzea tibetensis]TWP50227.1 hypothetical protein FKR81_21185 [Lentzea tibetensis]